MNIDGKNFKVTNVYENFVTVPDCWVARKNKIGAGNGEAKLYLGSKNSIEEFHRGKGFVAKVVVFKRDLLAYMESIKNEYMSPSQEYRGASELSALWISRVDKINTLDDIEIFNIYQQTQISGYRGYVNSDDAVYNIIREISLPLISFLSIQELTYSDKILYYWRLFADFKAIGELKNGPLVFKYGKNEENVVADEIEQIAAPKENKKEKAVRESRVGQGEYRDKLLEECPICPITKITDERLLIASHIKPWAVSTEKEKIDPKNGFMLSPLIDKLFDRGFITFTDNKHIVLSACITPKNYQKMGLMDDQYFELLPIDDERANYLDFHRKYIFQGIVNMTFNLDLKVEKLQLFNGDNIQNGGVKVVKK